MAYMGEIPGYRWDQATQRYVQTGVGAINTSTSGNFGGGSTSNPTPPPPPPPPSSSGGGWNGGQRSGGWNGGAATPPPASGSRDEGFATAAGSYFSSGINAGANGWADQAQFGGNQGQWNPTGDPNRTWTPNGWGGAGASTGGGSSAPDPYAGLTNTKDPLTQPGTAEDWYAKNAWRWSQPTEQQNYWNGIRGDFTNRYNPTNTQQQYNTLTGELAGPQQGTQQAWNTSGYFAGGPGAGENYASNAIGSGYFSTPGDMERYYTDNVGKLTGPQAGADAARAAGGALTAGPGAAEQNYGDARTALAGINYGQGAIGAATGAAGRAQNTQGFFGSAVAPFAFGNTVGDESRYFLPGLRDKSYSEKMLESGSGGLIDPYQRAQDKQTRQLSDAMAAKGMFNSGAAARAQEELDADIAASEAKDRISLAGQADASKIARTGAAQSFSQAAGSEALGRMGLGLTGAEASDASTRANADELMKAYGMASGEGLQKIALGTAAGSAAEQAMIQRLFQGGQLGLSADQDVQNALQEGGVLAGNAQTAGENRYKTGFDIAKGEQDLASGRMKDAADYGLKGDASDLERIKTLFGAGQGMDAADLAALQQQLSQDQQGFTMSGTVDAQTRQRLLDEFNQAESVQNLFQGRQGQDWNQGFALAGAESGLTAGATSRATDEQGQLALQQIQNLVNQGALTQQQGQQMLDQLFGTGKLLLQAKK